MSIPPRQITRRPNRHRWLLNGDHKKILDRFLRGTHKVLKWPNIEGLFYEPGEGFFELLTTGTDMNTINLDDLYKVFLDETLTTLVFEYARMADRQTSDRARLIVEYIMGPTLQTTLEMKPVRLGRINTRVEWVAKDLYSDPKQSTDFFWNLNRFLIPLYYLEYDEEALGKDSDGWGRYLSTTCTLDKAIDVFKSKRNSKMETEGTLIWTLFSVIYAWLNPGAVRKRDLYDWDDGARQLKARLFTVLNSDNDIDVQVACIVSSKLFSDHSILRAPPKASDIHPDLRKRDPTFGSGPELSGEGPKMLGTHPKMLGTPNPEGRGTSSQDILQPSDSDRPMPMPPRAKARGLTLGQLPEVRGLPSLDSTSGSAFALADGSEPEPPGEEAPILKSFLCPSPPPYSTRGSAAARGSAVGSESSGEEISMPEPFRYESPQKISIPRYDLLQNFGPRQKRLKLNNGNEKTPKIKIVSAKPRESQHPQESSPQITTASDPGYRRLDELASLAIADTLEKDKTLKAEKERAEKERDSKAKRKKPPRVWTEEECEICSCIIYAHQDTAQVPGGGYLCPSCVREDNLVFCVVCDDVFTETPYTHLDQDDQTLCFKCWKKGPQAPGGKVMNDLTGHHPIPSLLDLNLDLETLYKQPHPIQSQSEGEHQDRMDLDDSDAEVHKDKSHPTAKGENSATKGLGADDGSSGTSLISKQSQRINVSTANMIASTMRDYKKFEV